MKVYLRPSVLVVILLGFSSGLPLALTGTTLAVWMTERKVDIATIGLFHLVGPALHAEIPLGAAGGRAGCAIPLPLARAAARLAAGDADLLAAAILYLGFQDLGFTSSADGTRMAAPFGLIVGRCWSPSSPPRRTSWWTPIAWRNSTPPSRRRAWPAMWPAYRIGMLISVRGIIALVASLEVQGPAHESVWAWG